MCGCLIYVRVVTHCAGEELSHGLYGAAKKRAGGTAARVVVSEHDFDRGSACCAFHTHHHNGDDCLDNVQV